MIIGVADSINISRVVSNIINKFVYKGVKK